MMISTPLGKTYFMDKEPEPFIHCDLWFSFFYPLKGPGENQINGRHYLVYKDNLLSLFQTPLLTSTWGTGAGLEPCRLCSTGEGMDPQGAHLVHRTNEQLWWVLHTFPRNAHSQHEWR